MAKVNVEELPALLQHQVVVVPAQQPGPSVRKRHNRRIKTEEKAKVVATVWGEEFIQFCLKDDFE